MDSQSLKEVTSDPCALSVSESRLSADSQSATMLAHQQVKGKKNSLESLPLLSQQNWKACLCRPNRTGKPTFAVPTELESLLLPSQQNWKAYLCHPNRTGVKLRQTMVGFVPSLPDAVVRGTVGSFDVKHQVLNKGHLIQCLDDAQTCT